jgi:hypothetical protein
MTNKKMQSVRRSASRAGRSYSVAKKAPSRARAKQIVRSNRNWYKRLIMHPTATFAMLILGVFLAAFTYNAVAADYTVNAVVEAPPLVSGAYILNPTDNKVFTSRPISVYGECPDDSYVKLTRNGMFSGVAICENGAFQIVTDLFDGNNDLQAQDYNITDQPGPITPKVHVVYNPPAGGQNGSTEGPSSGASGTFTPPSSDSYIPDESGTANIPLLLSSDYHFNVFTTSDDFEWRMQYNTGVAPYLTHIDWGDGKKSTMTVPSHEPFKISHRYSDRGYYRIVVTGADAKKRTVALQLVAYIRKPGDPATNGNILNPSTSSRGTGNMPQGGGNFRWLVYAALPTYVVVVVMVFSFWLGERREFLELAMKTVRVHGRSGR